MAQHVARGIRVLADPLSVLGPFPRDGLRTSSFRLFRFIRPKTPLWSPRAREKGREREREERVSAFYRQNALWNWIARPSREGSSSRRPFHHAAAPLLAVLRFFTFPCLFFADDMPFSLLLFRSCLRPLFGVLAFSPELAVSFWADRGKRVVEFIRNERIAASSSTLGVFRRRSGTHEALRLPSPRAFQLLAKGSGD